MKKLIITLLCLIVLSGCTAELNADIRKDGSVYETIILSQDKSVFSKDIVVDNIINNYLEIYKDMLKGYTYEDISTDNYAKLKIQKEYDSVCSYFKESIFIRNSTENLKCEEVDGTYEIFATANAFKCDENCFEPPLIDDATLNITSSKKIISNNADEVANNKYTWKVSENSSSDINLIIKKSSNNTYKNIVILTLILVSFMTIVSLLLVKKYNKNRIEM